MACIGDMLANGEHDQAGLTALLGLAAVDQASIDEGRWGTAWFLTMLPEPPWRLVSRPSSSMEAQQPFSRMLEPRMMAALTGHLVFSTLHTNEACGAVTRLVNLQIEPYLIAATLRGVLAQRLVRKSCANCRVTYKPDDALQKLLGTNRCSTDQLWRGAGCSRCRDTGFAGRIGIFELLVPDSRFTEAVARGESLGTLRSIAVESGLVLLNEDGFAKAIEGLTTVEEVLNAVRS